jgi:hypothetical protein
VIKDISYDKNETWVVTAEVGRYDIRIRNLDFSKIIILENKSNKAGDQSNQLYRYWYYGIYKIQDKIKSNKYGKILYISPDYNKNPDNQTVLPPEDLYSNSIALPADAVKTVYFHDEIDKWLEECLNVAKENSDIYYYLKQYKEFWRFYYVV